MKEKHMMLAYILRLIQTESLSGTWNDFWFTSRLLFIFEDSAAWRNKKHGHLVPGQKVLTSERVKGLLGLWSVSYKMANVAALTPMAEETFPTVL